MPGVTSVKLYPHGEMARYTLNGCRCVECTKAVRDYRRDTYFDELTVPVGPYRRKLRAMQANGYSYQALARAAGVSESAVGSIIYGRHDRAARRIRKATADALDAVTISDVIQTEYGHVPAAPLMALLAELFREGARRVDIASAIAGRHTYHLQIGKGTKMHSRSAKRLCDYYAEFTGRNPWQVLDKGRATVSNVKRLADLLDTLWGDWLTTEQIINEFTTRWGADDESIRRALERLLVTHADCDCYRVRYVETTGTTWDTRLVSATNPYAREKDDHE